MSNVLIIMIIIIIIIIIKILIEHSTRSSQSALHTLI